MKTLNRLNPKLAFVALVVMAGSFIAPHTASADTARASFLSGQYREITVSFAYYNTDPAAKIYSDFKRTANHACREDWPRQLAFRKAEEACASGLLDKVVEKLGRADVAAVHQDRPIQVAVR